MTSGVMDAIVRELESLDDQQLQRVLSNVRNTARRPKGMSGRDFAARFAGLIPPDEMDLIDRAIETDCERVEPDGI